MVSFGYIDSGGIAPNAFNPESFNNLKQEVIAVFKAFDAHLDTWGETIEARKIEYDKKNTLISIYSYFKDDLKDITQDKDPIKALENAVNRAVSALKAVQSATVQSEITAVDASALTQVKLFIADILVIISDIVGLTQIAAYFSSEKLNDLKFVLRNQIEQLRMEIKPVLQQRLEDISLIKEKADSCLILHKKLKDLVDQRIALKTQVDERDAQIREIVEKIDQNFSHILEERKSGKYKLFEFLGGEKVAEAILVDEMKHQYQDSSFKKSELQCQYEKEKEKLTGINTEIESVAEEYNKAFNEFEKICNGKVEFEITESEKSIIESKSDVVQREYGSALDNMKRFNELEKQFALINNENFESVLESALRSTHNVQGESALSVSPGLVSVA